MPPWMATPRVRIYRKHYDEHQANRYAERKEGNRRSHEAECRLVSRALAGVDRAESIVDIPCGAGRMTVVLARLGFRPAAGDVSPAMVDLARQRCAAEGLDVSVEVQDLEKTSWPDEAFDNVFSFRFFHHLPDDPLRFQVAAELCRIARRRVFVSYLDAGSWIGRRRMLSGHRPGTYMLRPSAVAAMFTQAGFEVVADHARMPFFHSLRLLVARRPGLT